MLEVWSDCESGDSQVLELGLAALERTSKRLHRRLK